MTISKVTDLFDDEDSYGYRIKRDFGDMINVEYYETEEDGMEKDINSICIAPKDLPSIITALQGML